MLSIRREIVRRTLRSYGRSVDNSRYFLGVIKTSYDRQDFQKWTNCKFWLVLAYDQKMFYIELLLWCLVCLEREFYRLSEYNQARLRYIWLLKNFASNFNLKQLNIEILWMSIFLHWIITDEMFTRLTLIILNGRIYISDIAGSFCIMYGRWIVQTVSNKNASFFGWFN